MSRQLISGDELTRLLFLRNIQTWSDLTTYIAALPYGRNADRSDFSLVIKEGRGTCSSKHALLKMVADVNRFTDIQLVLCMYRMSRSNTPGIGNTLEPTKLDYIPEAHCYLRIGDTRLDYTSANSDISHIAGDILEEVTIEADQVVSYKVDYHRRYFRQWIIDEGLKLSFEEVWAVRERCIKVLSLDVG